MYYTITKKHIVIFSLTLSLLLSFSVIYKVFAKDTSWGLCFREANVAPEGNATIEELEKYNAYYMDNTDEKSVYLTFDVGYEAGYTNSILDTLKKQNVKAAFFIVGNFFDSDPDTVKRIDDEGHIVANHTLTHPDMSKMSTYDDFKAQILPNEEKYKAITGKDMKKFYRPPQGIYNIKNLEDANNLQYKTIFWSVAYVDWLKDKQPTREDALNTLMKRVHPGAIILLHSTSKTNMEILDEFITKLKDQGYTFKTLDQLGSENEKIS